MTVLNFGESRKYTGIHIKKFNIKTFSIQNSPKFNPTTYCQCRSKVYKHFFSFLILKRHKLNHVSINTVYRY